MLRNHILLGFIDLLWKGVITVSEALAKEVEELKQQIEELKTQIRMISSDEDDLDSLGARLADRLEETLRSTVDSAVEKMKQNRERIKEHSQELIESAEKKAAERPHLSILMAFGLGLLTARLLRR